MSRFALSISDRTELSERLGQVGRVLKLQSIVTWSIRLLVIGLLLDCLWLAGARFLPYAVRPTFLLIAPAALAVLGAIIAGAWHISTTTIARKADRDLGLKERLVTAIELQQQSTRSPLIGFQLRDAVEQLRRFDAMEAFPVRLPGREINAMLLLSLLAVGLVIAPNPMEQAVRQREQVAVTIKQEAERINKLADEMAAMEEPEQLEDVREALRNAASAISERQLSPEEANAALQRMEQQLLARQDPATGELEDALASLAGSLASEASTRDLSMSLARGDIRQAAQEMLRLGEEAESMSPAERSRMARAMRETANRTSRANPGLSQALQQASEALENGQGAEASSAMNEAARQLESSTGQLRSASQRERALAQLQQSRSAINRSQQAAQSQGNAGQRGGQGQQAGSMGGEGMDDFGGSGSGEGEPGSGEQPGGSGAGTGQGSQEESIYDPLFTASRPDFVPGQQEFDPNQLYQNADLSDPQQTVPQVSHKEVFAQYQEKATQTLQNTYIPAGLKDIVKDYFSSLAPDR